MKTFKGTVIGQTSTGYEPGAITAPNTYKPHVTFSIVILARKIAPQEPVANAGASDSEAFSLCLTLTFFLLEMER